MRSVDHLPFSVGGMAKAESLQRLRPAGRARKALPRRLLPGGSDVFGLGVLENPLVATFSADSALLDATERSGRI